jgi:hypothetical protein
MTLNITILKIKDFFTLRIKTFFKATHSLTTFGITTFSILTFSITTLCIMTFNIKILSIKDLFYTLSKRQ